MESSLALFELTYSSVVLYGSSYVHMHTFDYMLSIYEEIVSCKTIGLLLAYRVNCSLLGFMIAKQQKHANHAMLTSYPLLYPNRHISTCISTNPCCLEICIYRSEIDMQYPLKRFHFRIRSGVITLQDNDVIIAASIVIVTPH